MDFKPLVKASVLSLLVAGPAAAFAQDNVYTPCSFCGFTLGAGVGATTFMTDLKNTTSIDSILVDAVPPIALTQPAFPDAINSISMNSHAKVYQYDVMGRLFAGYGLVFENHTYAGLELGANFTGANKTALHQATSETHFDVFGDIIESDLSRSLDVKTKVTRNSVEPFLDLKLGFLTTPTSLVYVRGGINYNTFKLKNNISYDASGISSVGAGGFTQAATAESSYAFSSHKSKSEVGYRAGLGMEVMITPQFSIGADYTYSFYPNVKSSTSDIVPDVFCDGLNGCSIIDGTQTVSSKATNISDQQVLAQFIYHFGF